MTTSAASRSPRPSGSPAGAAPGSGRSSARPPSVERLLAVVRRAVGAGRDHEALVEVAREVVAEERDRVRGSQASPRGLDDLAAEVVARLDRLADPLAADLVPAINATGVILHTNLGRAPWPAAAIAAATAAAAGYPMLELDRATGRRGRRFGAAEAHLVALTGAEDALVTNNNAAAVALAVALAGRGGRVAVSRGELVEIGGGVRIPEVLRRAGVRFVEVGTTNRTRVEDFREPLQTGAVRVVLRVHPSNFRQAGFVEAPAPAQLAALAHAHGAVVVDDLGSGALLDTASVGLAHEPTPRESLAAGADVVTFSGDKLVGGPQAGLVVGRADLVGRMRRDPLARAMRPDKATLAGVAATLGLYRAGRSGEIPVWRMLRATTDELLARAAAIVERLGGSDPARSGGGGLVGLAPGVLLAAVSTEAALGGGSLPEEAIPSVALAIAGVPAEELVAALRLGRPAVVGRIAGDRVLLDLRTVAPDEDVALGRAIAVAVAAVAPGGGIDGTGEGKRVDAEASRP